MKATFERSAQNGHKTMDKNTPKRPFYPDKTLSAINIILDDLKKIYKVGNFVLQLLLIAYYAYCVIKNINGNTHVLVLKCVFFAFVLVGFVADCIMANAKRKNKKQRKAVKKTFKYLKLAVRIVTVAFTIFELAKTAHTPWDVAMAIVALAGIVLQFVIEIVTHALNKYIRLVKMGFEMDCDELKNSSVARFFDGAKNLSATAIDLIDKPVAALAKRREQPTEITEDTSTENDRDEKLKKQLLARAEQDGQTNKLKRQQRKEQKRQIRQERIKQSKQQLKEHWKTVFSRKNKK